MSVVLIPAFEPDHRLVALVEELIGAGAPSRRLRVLVVDDGSGPGYARIFAAAASAGATVLVHESNRGKGAALRTGLAHLLARGCTESVVCADSDGQHRTRDVLAVAARVDAGGADVVLGGRAFDSGTPLRSRVGNRVAAVAFRGLTGLPVRDTQTGLRGYPARMLPWLLASRADGFDYEMDLLLRASRERLRVEEVPIATVYLEGNARSHFRPLIDSARVALPFLAFAASSFVAFAIDTIALLLLAAAGAPLLVAMVLARLLSATINFTLNRRLVFRARDRAALRRQVAGYVALAAALLAAGCALLLGLTALGVPLVAAKLSTDAALALVSFAVQRGTVFARSRGAAGHPLPPRHDSGAPWGNGDLGPAAGVGGRAAPPAHPPRQDRLPVDGDDEGRRAGVLRRGGGGDAAAPRAPARHA